MNEILSKMIQICDAAEAAGRDLTDEEDAQLTRLLAQHAAERDGGDVPVEPRICPIDAMDPPGQRGNYLRDASGRAVRMYGPADRMSPVPDEPHGFGRLIEVGLLGGRANPSEREMRLHYESLNSAGGLLVPTQLAAQVADLVANESVLLRAGARRFEMSSDHVQFVKIDGVPSFSTKSEGSAFSETSTTFGAATVTAHTIGATARLSLELVQDSPNVAQAIEQAFVSALATRIDYLGIRGSGSAEPMGLVNNPAISTDSAISHWDDLLDAMSELEAANAGGRWALLLPPGLNNTLRQLKTGDGSNSAEQYLAPPPDVAALRKFVSNQIPTGTAILGDLSQLILGVRLDVQVDMSQDAVIGGASAFENAELAMRVWARIGFGVIRGDHIAVCS